MTLLNITWDLDPTMVDIFGWEIRWYGPLFACAFICGHLLLKWMFKEEGKSEKDLDRLTIYVIIGTIAGARLAHVCFYQPEQFFFGYFEQLEYFRQGANIPDAPQTWFEALMYTVWNILNIRGGGLASHGAAAGILLGMFLFSRHRPELPFLWVADRIVVAVAIGGMFVRLGNFTNSEICGMETDLPWGVIFLRGGGDCSSDVLRHPTQLYEALGYLLLFFFLVWQYKRMKAATPHGLLLSYLLIFMFSFRFLIEFVKVNQEDYPIGLPLNTGQLLSLPFIAFGVWMWFRARKNGPPEIVELQKPKEESSEPSEEAATVQ